MVSFECCHFLFVVGKKIYFVGISFKQCVRIISMSLFKYFEPAKDTISDEILIALSLSNKDKKWYIKRKINNNFRRVIRYRR